MSLAVDRKRAVEFQQLRLSKINELPTALPNEIFQEQLELAKALAKLSDESSQNQSLGLFKGLEKILKINRDIGREDEITSQVIVEFYRCFARFHRLSGDPYEALQKLESLKEYLEELAPSQARDLYLPFWHLERAEEHFKLARHAREDCRLITTVDFEVFNLKEARDTYNSFIQEYGLTSRGEHSFKEKLFLAHFRLGHIYQLLHDPEKTHEHFHDALLIRPEKGSASYKRLKNHLLGLRVNLLQETLTSIKERSETRGTHRRIPDKEVIDAKLYLKDLADLLKDFAELGAFPTESIQILHKVLEYHSKEDFLGASTKDHESKKSDSRLKRVFNQLKEEDLEELRKIKSLIGYSKDMHTDETLRLLKDIAWLFSRTKKEHSDAPLELAAWFVTRGQ